MTKNKVKKKSKGRLLLRITAWLTSIVVILVVTITISGIVALASNNRNHLNVTDGHGNIKWGANLIVEGWKEGINGIKGNFAKFGNHSWANSWGKNADVLNAWSKRKGKLTSQQLHGLRGTGINATSVESQGLYNYAKSLGIDPKAFKSNKSLLKVLTKYVNNKSLATDGAGNRRISKFGSIGKQATAEKNAWNKYTNNLLKAYNDLSGSAKEQVSGYLKKHGGTRGSEKWYEALKNAMQKYAVGKAKKELGSANKKYAKEYANSAQGDEKVSADEVEKMLSKGEMPEPTTFWGKIGRAIMNLFWSSSVGSWLEKNGAGASIFAGETNINHLASDIQSQPLTLIYPVSGNYSSMKEISSWLQPAMIALGGALITLALVITTMRMGVGQAIDPVRSRINWYRNVVDTVISVIGVAAFPTFVTMILQLDGSILLAFAKFMTSVTPSGASETIFNTALKLGFDKTTVNAISTGMLLGGSDFSGVIFEIIYLLAYVGLAIYIKYFYFIRAVAFTIIISIGPIFVALWSLNWGKSKSINWIKDFIGTVFIQCIHALTLTFMAMFMDWNNGRITGQTAQQIAAMINWQKSNPGKQFLNAITLGLANQGPAQTTSGASVFEVLVVGFIVMILFQPLSNSLANLFGISTNMLDNIHQSTSRTVKAGALAGGAAIGATALAPAGLALGTGKGILVAAKDGVKNAAKDSDNLKEFKSNLKNGFHEDFKNSMAKRMPFRSSIAKLNGIVGPGVGRLIGMAPGAGASDVQAMLAGSAAGGIIGKRAARLANKPLAALGLGSLNKIKEDFRRNNNSGFTDSKIKQANAKTNKTLSRQNKAVWDADSGHEAVDQNIANIQKQKKAIEEAFNNGNITADDRDGQIAELNAKADIVDKVLNDEDLANRMAQADANKQINGSYCNANKLARASRKALGEEVTKLSSNRKGESDQIQKSLAIAGAATNGSNRSRIDGDAINTAAKNAKQKYAEINGDKFSENGFVNRKSWMDSNQYRQGESEAMKAAREHRAIETNGKIFSMPDQTDNPAFGNSMVNKTLFKQSLSEQMQKAGVSKDVQQDTLNAIDGVSGQALISNTKIHGSNTPLETLDYGLNNRLIKQRTFSINNEANSAKGAIPISAYELEKAFNDDTNPSTIIGGHSSDIFTAKSFQDYLGRNNSRKKYQKIQKDLAESYADYQKSQATLNNEFDKGAEVSGIKNWLNVDKSTISKGTDINEGTLLTPNDYIASSKIANYNKNFGPSGISPQEAIKELSYNVQNSTGANFKDGSGIKAGDLQVVTNNTGSYVRAKIKDGEYHLVGNYGLGDPSLAGDETIFQNLDLSPDGSMGPRYDPSTHRIEEPYSIFDNLKIPRSYTNGGPDLHDMVGNYASKVPSTSFDISDYRTMQQAPELIKSKFDGSPITLDKLSNYSDYHYYSDGNHGVIVGKDKSDNLYKQVSNIVDDDILDTHVIGQQYSIPLKDTGNGLIPDDVKEPIVYSKSPITKQSEKQVIDNIKIHTNTTKSRLEFNQYLNGILSPTEKNLHNYIASNPAHLSIDDLDMTNL